MTFLVGQGRESCLLRRCERGLGRIYPPGEVVHRQTDALDEGAGVHQHRGDVGAADTAPIHERDIAAVAVAALIGAVGTEASGLLTGPELLTQQHQVELIGTAISRKIEVDELSEQAARQHFSRLQDS